MKRTTREDRTPCALRAASVKGVAGDRRRACPFCEGINVVLNVGLTCNSALAPEVRFCTDCGKYFSVRTVFTEAATD